MTINIMTIINIRRELYRPIRRLRGFLGESEAWDGSQREQDEPIGGPTGTGESIGEPTSMGELIGKLIDQFYSSCN
jgi:hypothetical protein